MQKFQQIINKKQNKKLKQNNQNSLTVHDDVVFFV